MLQEAVNISSETPSVQKQALAAVVSPREQITDGFSHTNRHVLKNEHYHTFRNITCFGITYEHVYRTKQLIYFRKRTTFFQKKNYIKIKIKIQDNVSTSKKQHYVFWDKQ